MRDWTARAAASGYDPNHFIQVEGVWLPILSGGKGRGGGVSETRVIIPPPTAEEKALQRKQIELLEIQILELKRQNTALEEVFPEQKALLRSQVEVARGIAEAQKQEFPLIEAQTKAALEQVEMARRLLPAQERLIASALADLDKTPDQIEIERLSNQRTLAILRGEALPLLPGQQENIDLIFGRAKEQGEKDLKQFGEELAAMRGMRLTDSPIGGEVLRQAGEFASNLAAAKAGAELDFGSREQQFSERVRQFQSGLRQSAEQTRLMLLGRGSSQGLPLQMTNVNPVWGTGQAGQTAALVNPMLDRMQANRLAATTTTSRTRGPGFNWGDFFANSINQGFGTAALIAATRSSARFKKAIEPYDRDEYDEALRKVRETPIARWKYRWEGDDVRPHTGPILELSPEDIKADELHVDLLSYVGLEHAAIKALDRKVERVMALIAEGAQEHARKGRRHYASPA